MGDDSWKGGGKKSWGGPPSSPFSILSEGRVNKSRQYRKLADEGRERESILQRSRRGWSAKKRVESRSSARSTCKVSPELTHRDRMLSTPPQHRPRIHESLQFCYNISDDLAHFLSLSSLFQQGTRVVTR